MREYVVLTILNSTVVFNYRAVSDEEKVFVDKNGFYKDSLFYTLKYYKKHSTKIIDVIKSKSDNTNGYTDKLRQMCIHIWWDYIPPVNYSTNKSKCTYFSYFAVMFSLFVMHWVLFEIRVFPSYQPLNTYFIPFSNLTNLADPLVELTVIYPFIPLLRLVNHLIIPLYST